MNKDKCTPPSRVLTCLGITIDLDKNSLSIEKRKLEEIYQECINVRSKQYLTRWQFQSLLGKLIYLHKCIKPARIFINSLLSLFRTHPSGKEIKLTEEFFKDIEWFIQFLPSFTGTTRIFKPDIPDITSLYIDACLTGVGAIWSNRVYEAPVPNFTNFEPNITHLEMLNLLVALRAWKKFWVHSTVRFHCDNLAVIQVVSSGKTKDEFLSACINIWLITAENDIELQIQHIQGHKNIIADSLSRVYSNKGISHNMYSYLKNTFIWDAVPVNYFTLNLSI